MQRLPDFLPARGNEITIVSVEDMQQVADRFQYEKVRPGYESWVQQVLSDLGRDLVPIVKRNTPRASGRLARSTMFRVIRRHTDSNSIEYELQIIQTEKARQVRRSGEHPYFYWFTLNHGLHPSGKLRKARPPAQNLEDWVRRKISPVDSLRVAFRIAKAIEAKGIEPNTYLKDSMTEGRQYIQQASNQLNRDIIIDMENLPDIPLFRDL
jgi:hypothetical protein